MELLLEYKGVVSFLISTGIITSLFKSYNYLNKFVIITNSTIENLTKSVEELVTKVEFYRKLLYDFDKEIEKMQVEIDYLKEEIKELKDKNE